MITAHYWVRRWSYPNDAVNYREVEATACPLDFCKALAGEECRSDQRTEKGLSRALRKQLQAAENGEANYGPIGLLPLYYPPYRLGFHGERIYAAIEAKR